MSVAALLGKARWHAMRMPERLVERGLPPPALGWRWTATETPAAYAARSGGRLETVHPERVVESPLPLNLPADALDPDPGWWGFSIRDVPRRTARATAIATLPDCRIVAFSDDRGEFHPAVLTADGRSLELPQSHFRAGHGRVLRSGVEPVRVARATWIFERVYDNHSHWLTSHLPKLLLLRDRDALDGLVLPRRRSPAMEESMRMLGIDPSAFATLDESRPLSVGELTTVATDRFRPELLRPLREALAPRRPACRRVLVSRAEARGRKLIGEEAIWPELARRGFERVVMERLSFAEQVALMAETAVLLAPHGAGLTNMIFCPEGATIVELADPAYPNPNFYALAGAMGHAYALVHAEAVGDGHPLGRDLRIGARTLLAAIDDVLGRAAA